MCHVELILYSPLHFHLPDLQFHANSKSVPLKSTDQTRKKMSTVPHLAFFPQTKGSNKLSKKRQILILFFLKGLVQ